MSGWPLIGLLLGAGGVWLVFASVRKARASYVGVLFVSVAAVYHVLGEVLQSTFPGHSVYRPTFVSVSDVAKWIPLVGGALLIYAVAYSFTVSLQGAGRQTRARVATWWPRWTTLFWLTVPLMAPAIGATTLTDAQLLYWGDGIVYQYLLLASALTVFSYLRESPRPHAIAALALQSAALSLIGERLSVVAAAAMVVWAVALIGRPLKGRIVTVAVALLLLTAVGISASRGVAGRAALTDSNVGGRVASLQTGILTLQRNQAGSRLLDDFIYRVDGNAYGGALVARQSLRGVAPLAGLGYAVESMVPSFLWPHKLSTPIYQRNEEAFWDLYYNIPTGGLIGRGPDWLPTVLGGAYAYGSWAGLFVFAAILGIALAAVDLRLHRRISFGSVVVGMGLVWSVVYYERGFQNILLTMRGVLVVWCIVKAVEGVGRRRATRLGRTAWAPSSAVAPAEHPDGPRLVPGIER